MVTTTADIVGVWQMDLPPQSGFKDVASCWRIEHAYGVHLVVVPDAGPVYVDDIEVSGDGLDPVQTIPPLYVARSELAVPGGVATLGSDGLLLAAQRPAGGGSVSDATTTSKGIVQLAGDLAGTAAAPTVPGLVAKYVKPGGGIPASDLTAAVQASLAKADISATLTQLTNAVGALEDIDDILSADIATRASAAATTAALALKAPLLAVKPRYLTALGVVTLPDTSGVWAALAGFELSIPAAAGDWVSISVRAMRQAETSAFIDIGALVGSSIVRYLATGTASAATEGSPAWYPNSLYVPQSGPAGFQVQPGDLDGGAVRFAIVHKSTGSGNGKLFASTDYPFYWCATNHGPSTLL